jgi:hypothetical protein
MAKAKASTMAKESAPAKRQDRMVTFEIKTNKPLPVGEQVFVTGSVSMFGAWRPDGFPLTRMGENVWGGSAPIPADAAIEYKFTRGSWADEEILDDGTAPANGVIPAGGDQTVRRTIAGWKDGR